MEEGDVSILLIPSPILVLGSNGICPEDHIIIGVCVAIPVPMSLSSHRIKILIARDHCSMPSPIHQLLSKVLALFPKDSAWQPQVLSYSWQDIPYSL